MGVQKVKITKPFTLKDVENRDLVIEMLKYEDSFAKSSKGQTIYKTKYLFPNTTLNALYTIHRHVLNYFGFDTSDNSVSNYRTIFSYYYNSPTDYDKEVLSSVFYMRANKLVYYTKPKPKIGDKLINTELLTLDNKSISLFDILSKQDYTYAFIGAFSNS